MAENAPKDGATERVEPDGGLAAALEDLTDGITSLVRDQLALIRLEFKREATEAGARGANLLVAGGVAMLGYGFLLLAVILLVGWSFGNGAMALTALAIGALHLTFGSVYALVYVDQFRTQRDRIEHKTRSITGTESWQEENPEN